MPPAATVAVGRPGGVPGRRRRGAARRGRRISDGRNLPNIISDNDRSALRDYLCKLDFDFTVFCP